MILPSKANAPVDVVDALREERNQQIVKLHEDMLYSPAEIARMLDVSSASVCYRLTAEHAARLEVRR